MKNKPIALLLSAVVCFGMMAGCQSSELRAYSDKPSPEASATQAAKDYTPCYKSFDSDELMLTVDGIEINWDELFYWYFTDVSNMENYLGEITDWDAASAFDPEKTTREYVTENALSIVKHYCALQSRATAEGVALTDKDKEDLKALWDQNVASSGGGDEEAFEEYLEKAFLTKDIYNHVNEVSVLYGHMLEKTYGENGEKIDEAELLKNAADMGYMRAKHILLTTTDDTGAALPEDKIAEKRAAAEKLLAELKAISDPAAREKRFDELVAANSEDPGAKFYVDGYTFLPGAMVPEFESAVTALGNNEMSEIVQSEHGFHIILRLPLSAKAAVEYTGESTSISLGSSIAQDMFAKLTETWASESKVEFTKAYDKIDLEKIFAKAKPAETPKPTATPEATAAPEPTSVPDPTTAPTPAA
ncbi:MAG: peptidylprolyl isomerase [Oscillospiraceae bacterium]